MRKRKPLIALYKAVELYGWETLFRPRLMKEGYCEWCGEPLKNKRQSSCCSKECSRLLANAITWGCSHKGYAKQITIRDNYTCQHCGEVKTFTNNLGIEIPTDDGLEIHHILPVSLGGTDEPKNLICLCKRCHSEQHKKRGIKI